MPLSKSFYIAVGMVFLSLIFVLILSFRDNAETISAQSFQNALQQNQFAKLWVEGDYLYAKAGNNSLYKTLFIQIQPQLLQSFVLQKGQGRMLSWVILGIIFVLVFVVSFLIFRRNFLGLGILRQNTFNYTNAQNQRDYKTRGTNSNSASGVGNKLGSTESRGFGIEKTSDFNKIEPLHSHIKFSDVAGISEAKEELLEILDFLKHPAKYSALGISLPKGVLLSGVPGVGKTLIAKALAGESGVPFFYQSGASFVEMYVGVGAKRVRELFSAAKASAPCIVFIDEIDAIGKKRTSDSHNSERESTLNQLLVEMDGFSTSSGVIVLGATNHIEALDSALLRSGRFDRKVFIELPNFDERTQILKMYLKSKKSHINPAQIAKKTSGFSGAMLATLVNEAALNTARREGNEIEERDFEAVYGKISSGKRRLPFLDEKAQKIYALYQASKIIFALKTSLPLQKATLFETSLLELNRHTIGTNELLNRIYFLLIGSVVLWEYCGEGFGVGGEDFCKAIELVEFGKKNGLFILPNISKEHLGGLFSTNDEINAIDSKASNMSKKTQRDASILKELESLQAKDGVEKLLERPYLREFLQDNMTEILLAGGALLAYERLDWHAVESSTQNTLQHNKTNSPKDDKDDKESDGKESIKSFSNGAEFVISAFAPTVLTPFNALSKDYFNESQSSTQSSEQEINAKENNEPKTQKNDLDNNTQQDTPSRQEQEKFIVQNAEILAKFIGLKF